MIATRFEPIMTVSPDNKALARYLRSVISGSPIVTRFWDDAHHSHVDIMQVQDSQEAGLSALATLGLSDTPIGLEVDGKPLRVEIVMICRTVQGEGQNILATCAFNVINSKVGIKPGVVFPRVMELYRPTGAMLHVLLSPPYLWDLETQDFESKKVAWLHAIPISDDEYAFAQANGSDALERLLEEHQIDASDLDRKSAI